MSSEGHEQRGSEWDNLRDHQISYRKNDEIYIAITILKQTSPPLRINLLKGDQAPGALLRDPISVRDTVMFKSDLKMELDAEMAIKVDSSDIKDFILPASF